MSSSRYPAENRTPLAKVGHRAWRHYISAKGSIITSISATSLSMTASTTPKEVTSAKPTSHRCCSKVGVAWLVIGLRLRMARSSSLLIRCICYNHAARTDSYDNVKMEVWHAAGRSKPTFEEAKRKHYRPLKKGERFGPSWTNHWVSSDKSQCDSHE